VHLSKLAALLSIHGHSTHNASVTQAPAPCQICHLVRPVSCMKLGLTAWQAFFVTWLSSCSVLLHSGPSIPITPFRRSRDFCASSNEQSHFPVPFTIARTAVAPFPFSGNPRSRLSNSRILTSTLHYATSAIVHCSISFFSKPFSGDNKASNNRPPNSKR
jgi:hypothetical protein